MTRMLGVCYTGPVDRYLLKKMYEEGLSMAEIGRRMGRSRERVRQVVKKMNLRPRPNPPARPRRGDCVL